MSAGTLVSEIRVVNFRSARQLVLRPGPICAFIGEPGAGKSNVLLAARALLDPTYDLSVADVTVGERGISIEATLADGRTTSLAARNGGPPIAHFPAELRGGDLLPPSSPEDVHTLVHDALTRAPAPRLALARALGARAGKESGRVVGLGARELFRAPHA